MIYIYVHKLVIILLNQACASQRLANNWFLEITFVLNVCVSLSLPQGY